MKRTKKFLSFLLSVILLMTIAMPVMAEENTQTGFKVTITDTYDNHKYQAYQIFSGEYSGGVLTELKWGSGFNTGEIESFVNKLKTTEGFNNAFKDLVYDSTNPNKVANDIVEIIEDLELQAHDAEFMKIFAKILHEYTVEKDENDVEKRTYIYLTNDFEESVETTVNGVSTYSFNNLDAGYYLFKDRDGSLGENDYDYYTRLMLYVVKNIDIFPKGDVPKVTKSVNTTINGNYNEAVGVAMSDTVYFRLAGTVASNINDFKEYKYEFVDKLSPGLDLLYETNPVDAIAESYILHSTNNGVEDREDFNLANLITGTDPAVTIRYDGEDGNNLDKIRTLTITFKNLNATFPNLLKTDQIVIKYKAKLNQYAVHGTGTEFTGTAEATKKIEENQVLKGESGNENDVYIVYSNDPQGTGTGKTPEDDARVYTFQININKVNEDGISLSDAVFLLYHRAKEIITEQTQIEEQSVKYDYYYAKYAIKDENTYYIDSWVAFDEPISYIKDGKPYDENDRILVPKSGNFEDAKIRLTSKKDQTINIKGLAASTYFLHEIDAPSGYNMLKRDVEITFHEELDEHNEKLESLKIVFDADNMPGNVEDGSGNGTIVNYKGSVLPSTGGTGRTFLYVGGAAFATIAVVLLVTKKRMKSER